MVISLYPIDERRGIWSFREQPGATPLRVRVPAKSVLREVRGMGLGMSRLLFVPHETDTLFLGGWCANSVMREATREGGRFSLIGQPRKAEISQI